MGSCDGETGRSAEVKSRNLAVKGSEGRGRGGSCCQKKESPRERSLSGWPESTCGEGRGKRERSCLQTGAGDLSAWTDENPTPGAPRILASVFSRIEARA